MKLRILGCGTSGGVPRVDGYWGRCDPSNPKNRRRRVSLLVESGDVRVIVDTSPDLREQLLDAGVNRLDGVFFTHDHADHTHGIDDLRGIFQARYQRVDCYGMAETFDKLMSRFGYVFEGIEDYPAIATAHVLNGPVRMASLNITPFRQIHGPIDSLGYRFRDSGGFAAYSTDLIDIPDESAPLLQNLDVWVVDALRYEPHPTHFHLERTLEFIDRYRPKRAILTHMNWDMDYDELCASLPDGVEPAYDGMEIHL